MIPTETLQIVRAVAHFRNFTAAAKHLHKVPSAISYTVRKLEDRLGVQLFLRDSKRVELTPAGEHFMKHTDKLLASLEELENTTRQMASGWEQEIRIAMDNVVNQGKIYDLIHDLQEVRPEAGLVINTEVFNGSWDALYHGRCQVVIGAPREIPENIKGSDRYAWRSMGEMSWDFVVAPNHPLAKIESPLPSEDLKPYPSICVQDTSRFFRQGYNFLLEDQQLLLVPSFRATIESLLRGQGVAILPSHFVHPYIEQELLIKKDVVDFTYNDTCLLAWNQENMGSGLKWILDWLGSEAWLNKVWLQYDKEKPAGYHVP